VGDGVKRFTEGEIPVKKKLRKKELASVN